LGYEEAARAPMFTQIVGSPERSATRACVNLLVVAGGGAGRWGKRRRLASEAEAEGVAEAAGGQKSAAGFGRATPVTGSLRCAVTSRYLKEREPRRRQRAS
jgi:hypothetical protein